MVWTQSPDNKRGFNHLASLSVKVKFRSYNIENHSVMNSGYAKTLRLKNQIERNPFKGQNEFIALQISSFGWRIRHDLKDCGFDYVTIQDNYRNNHR